MSDNEMDDELADFIANNPEMAGDAFLTPEQVFTLLTILTARKLKIKAHLVDKDGERMETSEVATDLVKYVEEQMAQKENNAINTQVFPLIGQLMISFIPRAIGMDVAGALFAVPMIRNSFIQMGMAAFLMLQYIKQHNLKIVTEEEEITEQELNMLRQKEGYAEEELGKAIKSMLKGVTQDDEGE